MKRIYLALLLCMLSGTDLFAQEACPVQAQTDRGRLWQENQAVNIWIDPAFGNLSAYFPLAVSNWANSSTAQMMGVTLSITTDSSAANVHVYRRPSPDGTYSAGSFGTYFMPNIGLVRGEMTIHPDVTDPMAAAQTFAHELGHPFGLNDCETCPAGSSVMRVGDPMNATTGRLAPSYCDESVIQAKWEATFNPDPCDQYCNSGAGGGDGCYCPGGPLKCPTCTPVILDLDGDGIDLTTAADGVDFAMNPGAAGRLGWTLAGDDDGWLALDRNCSGSIDDGSELFGNYTEQPASAAPNGYEALAVFDANGDKRIDAADPVFRRLIVWTDRNHDGRSTPDEIVPLTAAGVESIDLAYRTSGRHDQHGNYFRYRAKVTKGGQSRWSYDVFLATIP